MRISLRVSLGLCSATLALAAGCNRHGRQAPDYETGDRAGSRANRSAVQSIARARCEREERCQNIGADEKYASKAACLEQVRSDWSEELHARECPSGVRAEELDECLEDIRDEDCNDPFDSLQRTMSCAAVEICSDPG